jgi:hypothetical protein
MMLGCATDPYQSCNVDRKAWRYIPPGRLDDVDIEARRLVGDRSISEFLYGEVVQKWFRDGDTELLLCRQSRHAMDFCFANFNRFAYDKGAWSVVETWDIPCTE